MVNHNVVVVSFLMLVLILGIEFSECRRSLPIGNKHKQKLRLKLQNDQYTRWLHRVSSAGKNLFGAAKNKDDAAFFFTVASVDGVGDFTSIQDAIDALPVFNMLRAVIKISCGIYKEKVLIPSTKAFVTLEGDGADCTEIQWSDTAGTIGPNGKPLGTYSSATVAVNSPYFIAKNITFKNTAPIPAPGAVGGQGVALRISGDAASFYGCKFIGAQDTLYDQMGRHYFKDCYIEGSVDFIFGDGLSLYEGCLLHGVSDTYGAVTAQKREKQEEDTGFAFVRCRVTGSGAYFLGRAWGSFSRVVFAYTYMDNIVVPSGWHNWGDPTRETTVFYGQYKCTGPGASFAGRVSWARELTDDEVKPFLALTFIDGRNWIIL